MTSLLISWRLHIPSSIFGTLVAFTLIFVENSFGQNVPAVKNDTRFETACEDIESMLAGTPTELEIVNAFKAFWQTLKTDDADLASVYVDRISESPLLSFIYLMRTSESPILANQPSTQISPQIGDCVVAKLQQSSAFRRRFVWHFCWADSLHIPDRRDLREPNAEVPTDFEFFPHAVSASLSSVIGAGDKLENEKKLLLLCYAHLFSFEIPASGINDDSGWKRFAAQLREHIGKNSFDTVDGYSWRISESRSAGSIRSFEDSKFNSLPPLNRPYLPCPEADRKVIKLLELAPIVCAVDAQFRLTLPTSANLKMK